MPIDDVRKLFAAFDMNRDGSIQYDEFLRQVRGDLNAPRQALVNKAFNVLDADGNGYLDYQDVMGKYDTSKHPAVIDGRKTERQVLEEFLSTFEQHKSQNPDGIVTPEEFSEYYANVSASIDDDAYFAQMMNSSWNLDGAASSYASYGKGWGNKAATAPKANKKNGQGYSPTKSRHVDSKLRSGMESTENPFTASKSYYE